MNESPVHWKIESVSDVVAWRMCSGCGACAGVCRNNCIQLVDVEENGIRPVYRNASCTGCKDCLRVCPGIFSARHISPETPDGVGHEWGSILDTWEGHSTDDALRFHGSSGGVASAMALFCIEKNGAAGVVHSAQSKRFPWKNETVITVARQEIIARAGSRYNPASPCELLNTIAATIGPPFVFIGKPCDITAVRNAQSIRPELTNRLQILIGIFCAGTPSTSGVLRLLSELDINKETIDELRFRGMGWPGNFGVRFKQESEFVPYMSYAESWEYIQKYRPFRCYLCPDGTSENADIAVGDPWYRKGGETEKGSSLIVVRTEKGRELLRRAVDAGYIEARPIDRTHLMESQVNLLKKRREIWGRCLSFRMCGLPHPRYDGNRLLTGWLKIGLKRQAATIFGTFKRIITRNYFRRMRLPVKQ
jgi:coenzyme F420 hydrogenase subunit beta